MFNSDLVSAVYNDGDIATALDGNATVTDGGVITYQWQQSGDSVSWSNIAGATSATYLPNSALPAHMIRSVTFYRVVATNYVDGLYPSESLFPSDGLYPSNGTYASSISTVAKITVYPKNTERIDIMIKFTDPRLFAKGTSNVVLIDPATGNIVYQSDMFTTANITTSNNLGEIRAGIGNPIVATIPSDAGVTVEFTAADFSLWEKAAQVGADVTYGAPVPAAQTVTATGTSLSIDVSNGVPVAQLGLNDAVCYVQEVGKASLLNSLEGGRAYPIDSTGAISGFIATSGVQYKVWYFVQKAVAQKASITTLMDPKTVHFSASIAVYKNVGGTATSGTLAGWLYVTVPLLKFQANANIDGGQSNPDTTAVTGIAISSADSVVSPLTDLCGQVGNNLAFYVYSPCDEADVVQGLAVVGGVVSLPVSSTAQIPVRFVMPDNSLQIPPSYATGFTYTGSGLPSGTTVSGSGLITSGTATGEGEVVAEWTDGTNTYSVPVNVEVTSA